jgi:fructokinase
MVTQKNIFGCIEAGGTKFVLGIASAPDQILETVQIDTTTPAETINHALQWFQAASEKHGQLSALGIASFGPADINPASASWGYITATPKKGWSNTDIAGPFAQAFSVPVGFDTDVNGAVRAETRWGAGKGKALSVYMTIGTGIGGGISADGKIIGGIGHPEIGHMRLERHPEDHNFAGICPFHGCCLEGLASGPAVMARWGKRLSDLPSDHVAHEIIAWYLAQCAVTLQAVLAPARIIMGGGVMQTPGLLDAVRLQAEAIGGGYFAGQMREIIVRPGLGDFSGLLGGLALAQDALEKRL